MRNDAPLLSKYSPGVLSLLPLYYIGWADSVLSPSEVNLIRDKVKELDFLTDDDKKLLLKWWNPASPPSHHLFKEWISILQKAAQELPQNKKRSLVDLGLEIAQKRRILAHNVQHGTGYQSLRAALHLCPHATALS